MHKLPVLSPLPSERAAPHCRVSRTFRRSLKLSASLCLAMFFGVTLLSGVGLAQDWDEQWYGVLDVGQAKLRLQVQVRKNDDGAWEGHVVSLDQNQAKLPIGEYEHSDKELNFTLSSPPATFSGTLNDEGTVAEGKWNQGGAAFDLKFEASEGLEKKELDSVWNGLLKAGGRELEMRVRVLRDKDGELSVELDSLTEGIKGIAGEITMEGEEIELEFPNLRATYSGTIDESSNHVDGEWKQAGQSFELNFDRAETNELPDEKVDVEQIWFGELDAGLAKVKLQFRVLKAEGDEQKVLLDSLTEGLSGVPGVAEIDDEQVTFTFSQAGAVMTGTLDESKENIDGTWKQGGLELPLDLVKRETLYDPSKEAPKRPQVPQGPFPYESVELTAENKEDDVTLAGTLTIPEGDGPFPAAILISGSGGQDRDETLLGHKPFLVIADALSRQGIAVLRFDDRGVAKSTGDHGKATTEDFSRDVSAWVDRLKDHESVDGNTIGLIGHSEGGLIGPIVATKRDDVAFCVLLAGPGSTGEEIIYQQTRLIAGAAGLKDDDLDIQEEFLRKVITYIKDAEGDEEAISKRLEEMVDEQIAIEKALEKEREDSDEPQSDLAKRMESMPEEAQRSLAVTSMQRFNTPWFKYFLVHDPIPVLEKVDCPVLAIIGEKDLQVPYEPNLELIREALKRGGNENFEVKMLPELNHLFQHAETGSPSEYESIEETFDEETLQMIIDWIKKNA